MNDLDTLRARRKELQDLDDAVSYVRRVAQGRADLARAELSRRQAGADAPPSSEVLRDVLADRLLSTSSDRPPRPVEDFSSHPRADELDRLCAEHGFGQLLELDVDGLTRLAAALDDFEVTVSAERQEVFAELDALTTELVAHYRQQVSDGQGAPP